MQLSAIFIVLGAMLHRVVDHQIHVLLQDLDVGLDFNRVDHVCAHLVLEGAENDSEEEEGKGDEGVLDDYPVY